VVGRDNILTVETIVGNLLASVGASLTSTAGETGSARSATSAYLAATSALGGGDYKGAWTNFTMAYLFALKLIQ
jgi:hypothetical protein